MDRSSQDASTQRPARRAFHYSEGRFCGTDDRFMSSVNLPCPSEPRQTTKGDGLSHRIPLQREQILWDRRSVYVVCQPALPQRAKTDHQSRWSVPPHSTTLEFCFAEEILVCAAVHSSSPLSSRRWRPPLGNRKCCCGGTGRSSPRRMSARAAPRSPLPDSARCAPGIRPPYPPLSSARWWRRAFIPTLTSAPICAPRRASATPSDSTFPTRPCPPKARSAKRGGSAPSSNCP